MAAQSWETALAKREEAKQAEIKRQIEESLRLKDEAMKAVAKGTPMDHFLADQMLKKDPSMPAKELADAATEAYRLAMNERDAFDRDIDELAMAAFKLNRSRDDFVKQMQEKYFNQSASYVLEKATDAWNGAAKKIQEEIQDELKKAEKDQLEKTKWREEAIKAQEQGMAKDEWKRQKLAEINEPVTEAVDSQLADEAWIAAPAEIEAIKDAKDAIDRGKTQDDFEREETSKNDPNDARTLADKIADAGRAWAEAVKQIAEKLAEEAGKSSKDKEEMDRLIKEAREAIQKGKSLDEFKNE